MSDKINPRKRFTHAQEELIVSRHLGGETIRSLAAAFSCGTSAISNAIKNLGAAKHRNCHPLSVQREVESLYSQGLTAKDIMSRTGCTSGCLDAARRRTQTRHRVHLSLTMQQEICQQYQAGATYESITADYGIQTPGIRAILRRLGVPLRKCQRHNEKLSGHLVHELASMIEGGMTISEAAARNGIGLPALYSWINRARNGDENPHCVALVQRIDAFLDGRSASSVGARRYAINERFFETIDTEEKAWLLGFVAADGCVRSNSLAIKLSVIDVEILESIRLLLDSTAPISYRPAPTPHIFNRKTGPQLIHPGPTAELCIHSKLMADHLAKLGICERKAAKLSPWNGPPVLLRHYYRGLVDGDGTLCQMHPGGNKRPQWSISLLGTHAITHGFSTFIRQFVSAKGHLCQRENIWSAAFAGNRVAPRIAEILYGDAKVALARKHALAAECMKLLSQQ